MLISLNCPANLRVLSNDYNMNVCIYIYIIYIYILEIIYKLHEVTSR